MSRKNTEGKSVDLNSQSVPGANECVSVIMPCYNSDQFIGEAIESVLKQTHKNIELIIIDDGSTDNSLDVIRQYGNAIKLITQTNQGPSHARNRGIHEAIGEFIAFLDSDDYWELDFIESMISSLLKSQAILAYCGWQNITTDTDSPPPFIPPDYENDSKKISLLRNAALWPIHGVLIRRNYLIEINGYDESLPACEDYDLWLRLVFTKPIIRVDRVLAYYRHHKALKETDKRGRDAEYLYRIKQSFIRNNPEQIKDIPDSDLRDCTAGGLMRRGYQCYWNRELLSAHRIFRFALKSMAISTRDLKYVLPSLLPRSIYITTLQWADRLKKRK